MTFNFESEVDIDFDFDYVTLYQDVCISAMDIEKCPYEAEISLLITDDASIKQINSEQRDIDKSTDVLSFPMNDYEHPADFSEDNEGNLSFNPETGELLLGDIVLSIDHIKSQALEYGHTVKREFAFLITHSMLHLMGYDHMIEDERIIMEERQKLVMNDLYIKYPEIKVD